MIKKIFFNFILFFLVFTNKVYAYSCDKFYNELNLTIPFFNEVNDNNFYFVAPLDFEIHNFSDLELKNNKYTAEVTVRYWYLDYRLNEIFDIKNFDNYFYCEFDYDDIKSKYSTLEIYLNTTEILKDNRNIVSFQYNDGDFYVTRLIDNVSVFRSTLPFNFKKFPFDTQSIDLTVNTMPVAFWDDTGNYIEVFTEFELDKNTSDANEWINETNFGWNYENITTEFYEENESVSTILVLTRDYNYYLLKVIFPILLIVFISWSVFLIHPRAIEAKVNVTIVCLLALIAYNFVIEDNLPKVSYITIMDIFILSSYLFSAIATVYAIFSYRLFITTEGDKIQLSKMDKYFRNFSFLIYGIVIITTSLIIFYL